MFCTSVTTLTAKLSCFPSAYPLLGRKIFSFRWIFIYTYSKKIKSEDMNNIFFWNLSRNPHQVQDTINFICCMLLLKDLLLLMKKYIVIPKQTQFPAEQNISPLVV